MILLKTRNQIFTALIPLLFINVNVHNEQTNFSGTWTRNAEKCTTSEGLSINSIPIQILVKQNVTEVEIKRTSKNGEGEVSEFLQTLKLDGSLSSTHRKTGETRKSAIKISADKKKM